MQEYKIRQDEQNIRLDKIIASIDNSISRTSVQRLIEEGKILVNEKQEKPSYKVNEGDIIKIEKEEPQEIDLKPQEIPIDIIYEDKDILIINKAKGMVVHPGNGNPDGTLVNAVMAKCKDSLSGIGGKIRPGVVHRIDKDTSRTNNNCQE
ncbi:MAG: RluA family pseudouridine synthase [Clostridia bacterium]|jgi:pseudouridylate synthase|nr:pseudouridine synthase [Clostridium sp. CAG:452]HJJ03258.1 RluA family pseudouridine synthase [Clostridiaceae bacterium]